MNRIGKIALLGSGETSASGGQVFDLLAKDYAKPVHVAVMETPAGFELNAAAVAERVAGYLRVRLQNKQPVVVNIAARQKNSAFSPDDAVILQPLLKSEIIFMGPGSPTYAIRQLQDSLAWGLIQARHRQGTALALASAAVIAVSSCALPVYEIFKVGEDVHWKQGLGLLEPFGLRLAIIPHWNNHQGGDELDTSCCFMGKDRFAVLHSQLDSEITVLGLEEYTGIVLDLQEQTCQVMGNGSIHIFRKGEETHFSHGEEFALHWLGDFHMPVDLQNGVSPKVWQLLETQTGNDLAGGAKPPDQVVELLEARQNARARKDWASADRLRDAINALGWLVEDTAEGARLEKAK